MDRITRFSVLLLPLLLAACEGEGMKDALGLSRDAPDEFTVVSRPPLSVPPEFTLRPPEPGAPPLGFEADDKAKSLLTGKAPTTDASSPGGTASGLLKRAGADAADSSIRDKLRSDATIPADTSNAKTLVDKIRGTAKEEPTVDAAKESERLRTNKDAGKPLTEGEVPENKPGSESLIDRIF
jgi:hypothetical protein